MSLEAYVSFVLGLRQILRPLTKLFHLVTHICCVLPVQDISESFKVDYYDFGCTIYYYTKFGGNWISSLAAHWKQRETQIEVYIDRENIHVWCRIRLTYLSFWELTRTL